MGNKGERKVLPVVYIKKYSHADFKNSVFHPGFNINNNLSLYMTKNFL